MSKSGGIVTTHIFRIAFRQFWAWWTLRLGEVLPASLVRRVGLGDRPDYREIDIDDAGESKVTGEPVVIRLAKRDVLVRATRYPFQAANVIPDLLAAEVDRFTPFDAKDVVLAHKVVEYDWATKEISVLFAAIRRKALVQIFERALAGGHVPAGAVIREGGIPLRFSEPGPAGASARPARPNGWMAAALVALLVALALPALMMERQNNELSARLAEVRDSVEAGAASVEQANRIENTRRFMERQFGDTVPPLVLLSELSRLIPQDSWVTSLNLQDNKLTLQGSSAKASVVVTALAGSRILNGVQYQSSITRDPRSNLERFSITATVVTSEENQTASGGGAGQ